MTPASDTALDISARHRHRNLYRRDRGLQHRSPHSTAASALRATRSSGLLPDGSGPDSIDLSQYKRIFVIAIGKAAGPMLEILLDRMKRRKGLRGICCTKPVPKKRNWRFRYFEGGHPLPNEESFAAARAALALLQKGEERYAGFLPHLRRRLGHVRPAPRPADHAR